MVFHVRSPSAGKSSPPRSASRGCAFSLSVSGLHGNRGSPRAFLGIGRPLRAQTKNPVLGAAWRRMVPQSFLVLRFATRRLRDTARTTPTTLAAGSVFQPTLPCSAAGARELGWRRPAIISAGTVISLAQPSPSSLHSLVVVRLRAGNRYTAPGHFLQGGRHDHPGTGNFPRNASGTPRRRELVRRADPR